MEHLGYDKSPMFIIGPDLDTLKAHATGSGKTRTVLATAESPGVLVTGDWTMGSMG